VAAIKAAQLGMSVTCIEKRGSLGGTCLNVGCIPSKALLHSSHLFHEASKGMAAYGVEVENVRINVPKMMEQKSKAVSGLTKGIEGLFKKNKVTYVKAAGKLLGGGRVEATGLDGTTQTLKAKHIILATGSEVTPLPGVPIDEKRILSSTGAIALTEVPKKMVVIGGGVIGLELGSVWSRLGSEVTVVEFGPTIVPAMDAECRTTFERVLKKQGLKFKMEHKVTAAVNNGSSVTLKVEPSKGGPAETVEADAVLVAIGRRPYTQGLGLAEAGVATDKAGRVVIDPHTFATSVPGVYAIGDIVAGPMLAHKAEDEGVACVETIAGRSVHINHNTIPSIIYTHPEVAWVGQTEEQLKAAGVDYKAGKFPMAANSRARTIDDADGVVKFLVDAKTDRILGAHIVSASAGELIAVPVVVMEYGGSSEDIARTCHGHPTLSEAVKEAALATYEKAIHF